MLTNPNRYDTILGSERKVAFLLPKIWTQSRLEKFNHFSLTAEMRPFYLENDMTKEKRREYRKRYFLKNPWGKHKCLIASRCKFCPSYNGERQLVRNLITTAELKMLWFRDKAYLMKRPSVDRVDSTGDYIFRNMRFLELKENQTRPKPSLQKKIKQLTPDLKLIKLWNSISEAEKTLKINNISRCAYGKKKTVGGYKWSF